MKAVTTTLSTHLHGEGNFLYLNIHMEREQAWPHLSLPHLSWGISHINFSEPRTAVLSPCKRALSVLPHRLLEGLGWPIAQVTAMWGCQKGKKTKPKETSLDTARCLWRKAEEGARLYNGRASEEKLPGRATLVTQLTGGIRCSGGRTSQEMLDGLGVFYRECEHNFSSLLPVSL